MKIKTTNYPFSIRKISTANSQIPTLLQIHSSPSTYFKENTKPFIITPIAVKSKSSQTPIFKPRITIPKNPSCPPELPDTMGAAPTTPSHLTNTVTYDSKASHNQPHPHLSNQL
jgi:hypothetical protein